MCDGGPIARKVVVVIGWHGTEGFREDSTLGYGESKDGEAMKKRGSRVLQ
jgi:hypothetical protein